MAFVAQLDVDGTAIAVCTERPDISGLNMPIGSIAMDNATGCLFSKVGGAATEWRALYYMPVVKVLTTPFSWNSTTPTIITDGTNPFSWSAAAGERWMITGCLYATSLHASPDVIFSMSYSGVAGGRFGVEYNGTTTHSAIGTPTTSIALATTTDDLFEISGTLLATTAGTVSLTIRNNTGTTVQSLAAGSWLRAERVTANNLFGVP
jgi:hypothetical protein